MLLVLAARKYQPQDVEEQLSGSNQKIPLAYSVGTATSRESTHRQTLNRPPSNSICNRKSEYKLCDLPVPSLLILPNDLSLLLPLPFPSGFGHP